MSTTVTFERSVAEDPELLYTRGQKPLACCRVLVNHGIQNEAGEWVSDEPALHSVKGYGLAATHVQDNCFGDPIVVHGLERTESWREGDRR